MKRLELILVSLAVIAILMNFNLVIGGALLGIVTIMLLACVYWPGGFFLLNEIPLKKLFRNDAYQGLSQIRIIGSAMAGLGFSAICIGLLFKLQNWNGADRNVTIGLLALAGALIVSVYKYRTNRAQVYRNVIVRSIVFGLIGIAVLSTSAESIERFIYRNHPMYLDVYEQYLADPMNRKIMNQLEIERNRATMSPEMFEIYMEHIIVE